MARTVAAMPAGSRISYHIRLGVIAKFFPAEKIHEVLKQTNRASVGEWNLPPHVIYYRYRAGVVDAFVLSRSAALPAGKRALAARSFGQGEGRRQIRHFPGREVVWEPDR